uniref:Cytochrome c oxidase subunit 2 n=1 Tax=Sycobia sp. 2 JXW-2020 TaxID=2781669 RepID=A0A8A6UQC5_9HYME|nr:cytochrome c oxidase subunit II [Sycobia sp. 2 JXW-2020]
MSIWGQMNFQDSNSLIMENMIMFYDHAMFILTIIMMFILYLLIYMILNKSFNRYMYENQMIEIIWTILPAISLFFLAFPSLNLLYLTDENMNSNLSIKVLANQWYWVYEYMDFKDTNVESYMIKNFDLDKFRLLDVDNHLILPSKLNLKFLVTSMDVIHSFTVPTLGIKIDAVPGRLNQIMIMPMNSGLYYGQCSEICGINHSFMPIVLEVTPYKMFLNWLKNKF